MCGLEVHGDLIRPGLAEIGHQPLGVLNHQVDVRECRRELPHGAHDQWAEGEVGHEVVVHHVAMDPVARGVHARQRLGQAREIRRQDAGRRDRGRERERPGEAHRMILRVAWSWTASPGAMREPGAGSCITMVPRLADPGGTEILKPSASSWRIAPVISRPSRSGIT